MSSQVNTNSTAGAVGLSDSQYAARRKRMFEFLTRVRDLGCVLLQFYSGSPDPASNHEPLLY